MNKNNVKERNVWMILVGICSWGTFAIYSASGGEVDTVLRYVKCLVILALIAIICRQVPITVWKKQASKIMVLAIVLMALLYTPLLWGGCYGARRYLAFGGLTIQPSWIVYLAMILFLAHLVSEKKVKPAIFWLVTVAVAIFISYITNQMYCAAVIFAIAYTISIMNYKNVKVHIATLGCAVCAIVYKVISLSNPNHFMNGSYYSNLIVGWLHPYENKYDWGYCNVEKLEAIKRGFGQGLLGRGLFNSQYEAGSKTADAILVVICEEFGIVGAIMTIGLLVLLIWQLYRSYKLVSKAESPFEKNVVLGVLTHLSICAAYKVLATFNMLPECASNLPFVSMTISENMIWFIEMGIVMGILRYTRKNQEENEMNLDEYFISEFNKDAVEKVSDYGRTIIEGNEIDKNLLLTGPKGNGKGLLMHRLNMYLKNEGRLVENVKAAELTKFRHTFYTNVDLMIIRDIEEVLQSKEKLEELVKVVKLLIENKVPIALTSSVSVETIPSDKIEELKIAAPSICEKIGFIKWSEESFKINLSDREVTKIAEKSKSLSHVIGLLNLVNLEVRRMNYSVQRAIENVIG